jgi:hypothetical protein
LIPGLLVENLSSHVKSPGLLCHRRKRPPPNPLNPTPPSSLPSSSMTRTPATYTEITVCGKKEHSPPSVKLATPVFTQRHA